METKEMQDANNQSKDLSENGAGKSNRPDMDDFVFCSSCGTKLVRGVTFCHKCGSKVIYEETVSETQKLYESQLKYYEDNKANLSPEQALSILKQIEDTKNKLESEKAAEEDRSSVQAPSKSSAENKDSKSNAATRKKSIVKYVAIGVVCVIAIAIIADEIKIRNRRKIVDFYEIAHTMDEEKVSKFFALDETQSLPGSINVYKLDDHHAYITYYEGDDGGVSVQLENFNDDYANKYHRMAGHKLFETPEDFEKDSRFTEVIRRDEVVYFDDVDYEDAYLKLYLNEQGQAYNMVYDIMSGSDKETDEMIVISLAYPDQGSAKTTVSEAGKKRAEKSGISASDIMAQNEDDSNIDISEDVNTVSETTNKDEEPTGRKVEPIYPEKPSDETDAYYESKFIDESVAPGEYFTSDADRYGYTTDFVYVNSPGDNYANIRYDADINSDVKYQWANGAVLDYLGETRNTPDGRTWINVGFYYWDDYEGEGLPRYMDGWISSKVCELY